MAPECRGEVVAWLVEVEMIIFVEDDRLTAVAGRRARGVHLRRDQLRIRRPIAVQQQEVRHLGHGIIRHPAAPAVAGADQ